MSNQELTLELKSTINEALNGIDKLVNKLNNTEKGLNSVNKSLEDTNSKIKNISSNSNKLGTNLKKAFSLVGVNKAIKSALSALNLSIDRSEQLNLFNVVFKNMEKNGVKTFSELGKAATKFQNNLNEIFGTNMTDTLKYQALFQSMGENVGIGDKYAAVMSETMTKLTYDLASLYNKEESTVAEALRAGVYAGQTKPLRAYGIDVTQTSMQPILDELGIDDRSVKQMSQAEKEILRYIATLKQAKVAMGDYANTIDSPANQQKVFKNLIVETRVAIGNLFVGVYSQWLPAINGILMVVKELANSLATLLGIEISDYNTGIATQTDLYGDLGDSIDDATKSAKELKRQTLGFDQIHNINENKDKGDNVSGGIDQRLLDAIRGYDNGMDKVKMKATEIRDRIMEWLGFTKETDLSTGKVSFKYNGWKTTLKNVLKSFSELNGYAKVLLGLGLVVGVNKLITAGHNLVSVIGSSGIGSTLTTLLSPTSQLLSMIKEYVQYSPTLTSGIATAISDWSAQASAIEKAKVALTGLIGMTISLQVMKDEMKSVNEEGMTLGNTIASIGSSLGSVASGALIGSTFGPLGTAIGAVSGAVASLYTQITQLSGSYTTAAASAQKYTDTLLENEKARISAIETSFDELEANAQLVEGLKEVIDSNGLVKQGYETRVNLILGKLNEAFGTEYKLTGNQITLNGKAVDSYKSIEQSIKDVIVQKKAQIALKLFEEDYIACLKEQKELHDKIKSRMEISTRHAEWYENALRGVGDTGGWSLRELEKAIKDDQTALENLNTAAGNNTKSLEFYSHAMEIAASGDIQELEKVTKEYGISLNLVSSDISKSTSDASNDIGTLQEKLKNITSKEYKTSVMLDTSGATSQANTFKSKLLGIFSGITITPSLGLSGSLFKASGGSFYNGTWHNIDQYDSGGIPSHGTHFVAGENGAEIVGHINGRTEVLNQSQLASVMYSAVLAAFQQSGGQEVDIRFHSNESVVIDEINKRTRQTGKCPIDIPA